MKKIQIVVCFIFITNLLFATTKDTEKYAEQLMQSKDYFRAISIYKELSFFEKNELKKSEYNLQIAKAYFKANKFELSSEYLIPLFNNKKTAYSANILMGLNYIGLESKNQAKLYFLEAEKIRKNGYGLLYLSYLNAQSHKWKEACTDLESLKKQKEDLILANKAEKLEILYKQHNKIDRKNPFLSGFLSAIIPGSGQIYAKQYFNGFMAFGYVTGLAYCTFLSYYYENNNSNGYISTSFIGILTGTFHISNIIGAYNATSYYNMRQEEIFFKPIKVKIFEINY